MTNENDKLQAESLAKSFAGSQVVADQIAVVPVGVEKAAKAVNSDLDQGIEKNLDAAFQCGPRRLDINTQFVTNLLLHIPSYPS